MTKTVKASCGKLHFEIGENKTTVCESDEWGDDRQVCRQSINVERIFDMINQNSVITDNDAEISKLYLKKAVLRSINAFNWTEILRENPFFNGENTATWMEGLDLKEKYGLSSVLSEKFIEYCDGMEIRYRDLEDKNPKLFRATLDGIGGIVENILQKCHTDDDMECLMETITGNGNGVWKKGDVSDGLAEPLNSIRDDMMDVLNPYLHGITHTMVGSFLEVQMEMEKLSLLNRIILDFGYNDESIWIKGKKVMYIGNTMDWPINIHSSMFECMFMGTIKDEYAVTVVMALEDNGITFADIMNQCKNEIKHGSDIRKFIWRHVRNIPVNDRSIYEQCNSIYHTEVDDIQSFWHGKIYDIDWAQDFIRENYAEISKIITSILDAKSYDKLLDYLSSDNTISDMFWEHKTKRVFQEMDKHIKTTKTENTPRRNATAERPDRIQTEVIL